MLAATTIYGSARSLVLITSRNYLAGLVAVEGAAALTLTLMSFDEARTMLALRLGADRVAFEREAVDEIVDSCARLPLALAIAAGCVAAQPRFALAQLAAQLREASSQLDVLGSSDKAGDLRAVLSWSYRAVTAEAAALFRMLGLHPGPDTSVAAAASLAALPTATARSLLAELRQANLVIEHMPGRSIRSTTCYALMRPSRPNRRSPPMSADSRSNACSIIICTVDTQRITSWSPGDFRSPWQRANTGLLSKKPPTTIKL